MQNNSKYYFQCTDCGRDFFTEEVIYLCAHCEKENNNTNPPRGVLQTFYAYDDIKKKYGSELFSQLKKTSFIDILPVSSQNSFSFLKVGNTPCYNIKSLNNQKINFDLFLKDDSQNPTFSFKDRASHLVSAYAKENGIHKIIAASTGNAGSSLAGICASQNQEAVIFVPEKAPKAKLTQIIMYGATIVPVDGTYDVAFDLSVAATKKFGWYNRNTAYNPLTIEGKKTVSFELFSDLNNNTPDIVFVPVGDGVIISGVYKGFEDLYKLKIIANMPVIIAVQSEGSKNIINNLYSDEFISIPSNTVADSISVDIPRNFYLTKKYLQKYKGESVLVSDDEILNASVQLSKETGIFAEPAAATAFAGLLKYSSENKITKGQKVAVLITGCGLKDLNSVQTKITIPQAIKPTIEEVEKLMGL